MHEFLLDLDNMPRSMAAEEEIRNHYQIISVHDSESKKEVVIIRNGDLINIQEPLEQLMYLTDCAIYGHHVNLSAMKRIFFW